MAEENKSRRDMLKITGGVIGGLVIGGVAGYVLKPSVSETVTNTSTMFSTITNTATVTSTVTSATTTTVPTTTTKTTTQTPTTTAAWVGYSAAFKPYSGAVIQLVGEDTDSVTCYEKIGGKETLANYNVTLKGTYAAHPFDEQKAFLDFATKTGTYDLFNMDYPRIGKMVSAGWLVELTPLWNQHPELLDPSWNFADFFDLDVQYNCMFNGKLYGVPQDHVLMFFTYNKKRTDDAGFTNIGASPISYDTYENILKAYTKPDQNQYGLGTGLGRNPESGWEWWGYYFNHGGEIFDSNGKLLVKGSGIALTTLQHWKRLADAYAPSGSKTWTAYDVFDGFASGLCTAGEFWNDSIMVVYDDPSRSKVVGELAWGVSPNMGISHCGQSCLCIPTSSKQQIAAWLMMQYTTQQSVMSNIANAPPYCPTRKAFYTAPDVVTLDFYDRYWKNGNLQGAVLQKPRPRHPQWDALQDALTSELNACFTGQQDEKTTLDNIYNEWIVIDSSFA
jgi:ABC-type glycerol-3-phosphate transport system substrate-binding protein